MMESVCVQMENNVSIYAFVMEYFHCYILLKDCQAAFLDLSEGLAKFKIHIWLTKKMELFTIYSPPLILKMYQ